MMMTPEKACTQRRPTRSQPGATIDPGIDRSAAHAKVIVQSRDGQAAAAATAVKAAGGTVGASLPIVNGFAASIPGRAVDRLEVNSASR